MTTFPHGTLNGYSNRGCRCDDCRQASLKYQAARKAAFRLDGNHHYRPPRLIIDGHLCCLICRQPYADHPLTKACFREAART